MRPTSVILLVLPAFVLASCGPADRHYDEFIPDGPRDDGGETISDADDGDEAEGEATPLPPEIEDNDPFHGGTAQRVEPPYSLAGWIGVPSVDHPDLDVFVVAGRAGQILRVSALPMSPRDLDLAVRVQRLAADGTLLWERAEDDPGSSSAWRDAFLPETGDYFVVLSDRANFSALPASWRGGGDDAFGYELGLALLDPPALDASVLPWTWTGTIPTAGFVQVARASPASGTRIEAVFATPDAAAFDPLLTVFDTTAGRVVAENDDGAGGHDALVRVDGNGAPLLFVADHVLTDSRRASSLALTLTLRALDPAAEAEPNDSAAAANVLGALPADVAGTVGAPRIVDGRTVEDVDLYRFDAASGTTYVLEVQRDGSAGGLDPWVAALRLVDGAGRLVPENPLSVADDSPRRGDVDARLVVTPRASGPLFVQVRDARNVAAERDGLSPTAGGDDHRYRVRVSSAAPPPITDLGPLPVSRDGLAATGGTASSFRFAAADGAPLSFGFADLSPAAATFAPLAYATDAGGATVLVVLEPSRGGSAAGWMFAHGAGGLVFAADARGSGGTDFAYRIDLRRLGATMWDEPPVGNDTPATAQPISWDAGDDGIVVLGSLDRTAPGGGPDALDVFRTTVGPGARLVAFTGPAGGADPDTVLRLLAGDGTVLAENDDVPGAETLLSAAAAVAGADGVVYVEISFWAAGTRGAYALFVGSP
jgi:hypothetical protein